MPKHRIVVATIVDGDRAKVKLEPHTVDGLELQPFEVPPAPAVPSDTTAALVTRARASYVNGDFDKCRDELAKVDLSSVLAAGNRTLASRAIAFEAACEYGAQAKSKSDGLAAKLASLGLELPDAPIAHDVETLINKAIEHAGKSQRYALAVSGEAGARLSIDGKSVGCTLPCTIDVPAGDHFVAVEADGFMPASRWVRVPDAKTVALAQEPANAQVATAQWRARIGRGLPANDAIGAKLLARLSGQPRIAYLSNGAGSIIVDGDVRASGTDDAAPELVRELAYDAGILKRPAIYQRPSFWIVTSAIVAAAAGVVIYMVYEPDLETSVGF